MAKEHYSFEEIDTFVKNIDLNGLTIAEKGAKAPVLPMNFCQIYTAVRPIILALKLFPLPKKWKDIIDIFIAFMDGLCPAAAKAMV